MPANRKHHATDTATAARWRLLGRLLFKRRVELGYRYRPAFAEARLPRTAKGNLMIRALNAVENGERPGTYTDGTMAMYARAYEVTEESMHAVLEGEADKLDPAPPASPAPLAAPVLPAAPPSNLLREDAARPYAASLWNRLMTLAARGVKDPDGRHPRDWDPDDWDSWNPSAEQLGLEGLDAETWNGSRGAMSLSDRGWLTGDWHARRAARAAEGHRGASSA